MSDPNKRDDLSRFLVHLTRDYEFSTAEQNLVSILDNRRIEARNSHCLFSPLISTIGFSKKLKKEFQTVCFTEAPLNQLQHLTQDIPKRKIKLKPYGIVFWKDILLDAGANPAMYVNSRADGLREFLLNQFREHFTDRKSYRSLRRDYGDEADSIIRYYAMINIISEKFDFSWEREWRFKGDLRFKFEQIVAIVVPDPDKFYEKNIPMLRPAIRKKVKRTSLVCPDWNYEEVVEEMAMRIWDL